jgi:hypothetical protein
MSRRTIAILLLVSFGFNVGLLGLVVARPRLALRTTDALGPGTQNVAVPPARPLPSARQIAAVFSTLDSSDLKSFIDRLRAAGVPHEILRAIAEAKVNDALFERRTELAKTYVVPQPYWSHKFQQTDPKLWREMQAVEKDRVAMLKEALGPDAPQPDEGPIMKAIAQNNSGGIPRENLDRMNAIMSDYNDLKGEIMASSNGVWTQEVRDKLAYLDKEQKADMATALSPDAYFEYQLRNSPVAANLRNSLSAFNPTEDEFRAVFKAQQDFNQQYGDPYGQMSPDQQIERQAHQSELNSSIAQALGSERYADYHTQTDPNYVMTNNFVQQLGLPQTATQQVVSVRDDIGKRADAIRHDPTLSDADRSSQMSALADEASSRLSAILGDNELAAYKQAGGYWIPNVIPTKK